MLGHMKIRRWSLTAGILLLGPYLPQSTAQNPAPPAEISPVSLPAHETHENFTVGTILCANEACSRQAFGKHNPFQAGILALDVYFRNDTGEPVVVNLRDIRVNISPAPATPEESPEGNDEAPEACTEENSGNRGRAQEFGPLSTIDAAQRVLYPAGSAEPKVPGTPTIGWGHSKNVAELAEKFDPLVLNSGLVNPHSTIHGYLLFDIKGEFSDLSRATLYVPDVHVQGGSHQLTYFEISLAPATAH